jgi:arsenical pump membrane protein
LFALFLNPLLVWTISLASILCMLLRPRKLAEAWWVCGGAALLVLLGLVPVRRAVHAIWEGLDVYLFLIGMMILAEMAREERVFDWAAGIAATHAQNSSRRLFAFVYAVGVVVTALLSNDATAVVLTPAVLAVVRRARVNPRPYLLACAMIANGASFLFPISNPANLVVFGRGIPPLSRWLHIFLLPSLASIACTFLCLRWMERHELSKPIEKVTAPVRLTLEGKLAFAGLLLAAAALIAASGYGLPLGATTCWAAALALLVVSSRNRKILASVARGIAWSVPALVAGLFVIVEGLENAGLRRAGTAGLATLTALPPWLAKAVSAATVALASNAMNNLPVGLMSGSALTRAGQSSLLAHALLIGVDLGPNLSVTGSLATILWLIALRREEVEITAYEFFRVGLIAMPAALAAALLVLWN